MQIHDPQFVQGVVDETPLLYDGNAQIVFIGRSNVGKSSTLNALFGTRKLVKTGQRPGKTQEINFFTTTITYQGERGTVYFVDIPGYGYAQHSKSRRKELQDRIDWYLTHPQADIAGVCVLLDAKVGVSDIDRYYLDLLSKAGRPFFIAINKIDKLNQRQRHQLDLALSQDEQLKDIPVVYYSAVKNKHLDQLALKLGDFLLPS